MFELLIVDDEIYIAAGIKESLNCEHLNISHVYVAHNIRQAKEIFLNHKIDLMICDIEMPGGNGFELLAWVKERYASVETIFLTCHAEFQYAKKAIQLGSIEYLLKPVADDELESIVSKALDKISRDKTILDYKETHDYYYRLWSSHQPVLIEQFWFDLFHRAISSNPASISESLAMKHIDYAESMQFLMIRVCVRRWEKQLTLREEKIMEYALLNTARELILRSDPQAQTIQVKKRDLLCIIPLTDQNRRNARQLKEDCERYMSACNTYFYCQLTCYIGEPVYIHEMLGMYETLVTLESKNVTDINKVVFFNDEIKEHEPIQLPNIHLWSELLKQGHQEQLMQEIGHFLDALNTIQGLEVKVLQEMHQYLLQMVYQALQFKWLQAFQVLAESVSTERAITATRSIVDLQDWTEEIISKAIDYIRNKQRTQTTVEKVKRYIAMHIDQDLTREDIASQISLHPDYIAKLFKKETGLSITDFIIKERVETAKDLLIKTDMTISNIALFVGYSNFSYFSSIFKKVTGMNPQDFRRSNHSKIM